MYDKHQIRLLYKSKRKEINQNEKDYFNFLIFEQFRKNFLNFDYYHIYISSNFLNEVDTFSLINLLNEQSKNIMIPKVINNYLEHYLYDENIRFKENKFKILEPFNQSKINNMELEKTQVVIVPMLVCDFMGNRIGYGKGFYDGFLAKLPKKTIKIGLNYFNPLNYLIPFEDHDIKLDYLISPFKIESFSEKLIK